MNLKKYFNVTLAKACTYRIISFAITFSLTLYITGDIATALALGPLDQLFKFFVYFAHEGQWNKYIARREEAKLAAIDLEVFGGTADEDDD